MNIQREFQVPEVVLLPTAKKQIRFFSKTGFA